MALGADSCRVQLTMARCVLDKLEHMAAELGVSKSQYLVGLINQRWKEENHTVGDDGVLIL